MFAVLASLYAALVLSTDPDFTLWPILIASVAVGAIYGRLSAVLFPAVAVAAELVRLYVVTDRGTRGQVNPLYEAVHLYGRFALLATAACLLGVALSWAASEALRSRD